jgi:hypothetical protein
VKRNGLVWLARTLTGAAIVAILSANIAKADNEGFIKPDTRIKGCIAIVNKVRDGIITPTEWLEQNKEEFADLQLELKERNYPPEKAKAMMMGMAITLCMERKSYENTCVTARDEERRDLQIMQTASSYVCWAKQRVGGNYPPPIPAPQPPDPTWRVPAPPPPPVPTLPPYWVPPPIASLPPMSQADLNQYNEDVSIISQPVRFIGDDEGGAKEARFGSCHSSWQSLSYNRSPAARQVLFAVRVARCMYRTSYAVLPSRCPSTDFGSLVQPRCYARF